MPASPQDTGGLGLLQLLVQHGVPLQALLSLLLPQGQAPQAPPQNEPREEPVRPGGEATPNIPDNETDAFGFGGATPGQIGSAALSGALNGGALGQAAQALGAPTGLGSVAAKGIGLAGQMAGVPGLVPSLANSLIGALAKVAKQSLDLTGKQVAPIRFGGPKTEPMPPRAPRGFDPLGDPSNPGGPSSTPGTTSLGLSPAGTPTLGLDMGLSPAFGPPGLPGNLSDLFMGTLPSDPNAQDAAIAAALSDAISAAIAEAGGANAEGITGDTSDGPAGGPGGNSGAPSGGGDSGNPGDF